MGAIKPTFLRLQQWRQQARREAIAADVSAVEVDVLLRDFCGWTALDRAMGRSPEVAVDWVALDRLWKRRCVERVPLQYLLGRVVWRDLELQVSPGVLIPRPETELLVDVAAAWWRSQALFESGLWADLGTGSGAIAIGLARACPDLQVLAVDCSIKALAVAQSNIDLHDLGDRVRTLQGSWFEPLEPYRHKLHGLVSNPPYIPTEVVRELEPEVRDREPHLALDGGESGLDALAHLVEGAPDYLQAGGFWLVELMRGQTAAVVQLLEETDRYEAIAVHRDLDGVERAVSACVRLTESLSEE